MPLGKLEHVDLRKQWPDEAKDFTPWLSSEEGLSLLGEAIGMELELEATEVTVGHYRADIVAKDTLSNQYVVIENQLESTNHDHIGKLFTYAAIEGRVDGNIFASEKVELKQKAQLIGDLQAKTLVIEEGVVFVGQCNVNPNGTKPEKQAFSEPKKEEKENIISR